MATKDAYPANTDVRTITRESMENEKKIDAVLAEVRAELIRATSLYPPMNSAHEAYGVIAEEFHEYFLEVIGNDRTKQRTEVKQVAAMACRAMLDLPIMDR